MSEFDPRDADNWREDELRVFPASRIEQGDPCRVAVPCRYCDGAGCDEEACIDGWTVERVLRCPKCGGEGELEVLAGREPWKAEPVYKLRRCPTCTRVPGLVLEGDL